MIHIFKKYGQKGLIFFLILLLTCQNSENQAEQLEPLDIPKMQSLIDSLNQDPELKHGKWALCIKSAETGQTLLEHQSQLTLNVASSLKTVTTMAALELLGSDFRFKTYLEYDGKIENGVLKGNLYIRGGGDPTLGSKLIANLKLDNTLAQWVGKVKGLGIRKIEGAIIADEEIFDENTIPYGWIWGDVGNYYGSPAGAINIFDNVYKLYFQPGDSVGATTKVLKTEPFIPHLKFVNDVKTANYGTGDQSIIYGAPYTNTRYTNGTIPMGGTFSVKGSIPDPGLLLASNFRETLKKSGIEISGPFKTTRLMRAENEKINKKRTLIHTHFSPSLTSISKWINLYSVNLYAEAIIKTLGLRETSMRNTMGGSKVIKEFWQKQGIDMTGFHMYDGSGLSLYNGITASQITDMLYLFRKKKSFQSFYASLPVAGVSGTMSGLCRGTPAQGNIHAKTGGMTRVISFVGYFTSRSGEVLTFALIANQYSCSYKEMQKKFEKIMIEMVQ